jgi:branched-chain amino acid transport system substrate-binding protein
MKRLFRTLPIVIVLALTAVGCGESGDSATSTSGSSGADTFRVGVEAPLSGDQANLGNGMLKGAQLAAERLNAEGGIDGKQVQIVPIDDKADPAAGVEAAKAALSEGLDGVIGPYNSGVGVKTLPLYVQAGLVPIRLTSDPKTNGEGFTLQPMTYQIAPVAAEALTKWRHAKTVAIVYDASQRYTDQIAKTVRSELKSDGVKVTAFKKITPGKKSYSKVVKHVTASHPDALYAAVYYPEGGRIAKAMKQSGTKTKCLADYGSYDTAFVTIAGVSAARNCPVVGVPAPDDFVGAADKVHQYRDAFDEDPGTWSPYTYDSLNFLAAGVQQAGGTDPDKLTEALNGLKGWSGWTGSVTIDPSNGNREPATVVIDKTNAKGELHVDKRWAAAVDARY